MHGLPCLFGQLMQGFEKAPLDIVGQLDRHESRENGKNEDEEAVSNHNITNLALFLLILFLLSIHRLLCHILVENLDQVLYAGKSLLFNRTGRSMEEERRQCPHLNEINLDLRPLRRGDPIKGTNLLCQIRTGFNKVAVEGGITLQIVGTGIGLKSDQGISDLPDGCQLPGGGRQAPEALDHKKESRNGGDGHENRDDHIGPSTKPLSFHLDITLSLVSKPPAGRMIVFLSTIIHKHFFHLIYSDHSQRNVLLLSLNH